MQHQVGGQGLPGWLLRGSLLFSLDKALVPLLPPCYLQPTGKVLSDSRLVQPLVYMERLELIRNVCRDEALKNLSHTAVSKFVLDRIFVCDKHKILFCQTPKVGNTQWKKVLIVLNGACSAWWMSVVGGQQSLPWGLGGQGCGLGRVSGGGQQRGAKGRDSCPGRAGNLIDGSLLCFPCWWCTLKSGGLKVLDTEVFRGPSLWSESPLLSSLSRAESLSQAACPTPRLIPFLLFRCIALCLTG